LCTKLALFTRFFCFSHAMCFRVLVVTSTNRVCWLFLSDCFVLIESSLYFVIRYLELQTCFNFYILSILLKKRSWCCVFGTYIFRCICVLFLACKLNWFVLHFGLIVLYDWWFNLKKIAASFRKALYCCEHFCDVGEVLVIVANVTNVRPLSKNQSLTVYTLHYTVYGGVKSK
jgi:hypothetical protein